MRNPVDLLFMRWISNCCSWVDCLRYDILEFPKTVEVRNTQKDASMPIGSPC